MRTRVGYTGGKSESPTYHDLDGHSETVQIDYDPARISYEELLKVFWSGHEPTNRAWSRQYASIIFFHNEEQKRLASAAKDAEEAHRKKKIHTELVLYTKFNMAENYHQKYWLQNIPDFMQEFRGMYPDFKDIVGSTAAARINGYLGSNGSCQLLREEWSSYGLSAAANMKLMGRVCTER